MLLVSFMKDVHFLQNAPGCPIVWVVWAESASRDASPSLLLGYALLASRRESALFLRMATGFGFAQVRGITRFHHAADRHAYPMACHFQALRGLSTSGQGSHNLRRHFFQMQPGRCSRIVFNLHGSVKLGAP